jgi:hypothetical protein
MPGALKAKVAGQWVLASSAAGGGGAEEVFIGPSDPGTSYDLWVDTDEDAPLTDDLRWNTAWGIVGMGSIFAANPVALAGTFSKITNPINLVTIAGRRYRIKFQARAVITATAGGPDASANFAVYDNGASRLDVADWYVLTSENGGGGSTAYNGTEWGALFDGDGLAHSFEIWGRAWGTNATVHVSSNCRYYIEDCGPIAGSTLATMSVNDRWNAAWGQVAASPGWDVALSAAVGVYTQVGTVSANVLAGRRYNFVLTTSAAYASGVGETWGWQEQIDGTSIGEHYWQVVANGSYINPGTVNQGFSPGTSGVKTFVVTVRRVNGTGTMQCRGNFVIMDLGPVSTAVAVADPTPAWIRPTFENGWEDYGYPGWERAGYRKIGDVVTLRGLVKRVAGDLNQQPMFTLPVGYRPPSPLIFNVNTSTTSYSNARFDVQPTGAVYVNDARPGFAAFTSLSGVSFSVTP